MAHFLADENIFTTTIRLLQELGLPVQRVQELSMAGANDPEVWRKAQELGAVLITNDQGFGDVRVYPPSLHHGMIVLKMQPDPVKVQAVHEVLSKLLTEELRFEHTLFIVDTNKYRKRTKP
jgi:predicted nuclease of predicted toxin-antitoxin system